MIMDAVPRMSLPVRTGRRYRWPVALVLGTAFTLSAAFTAGLTAGDLLPAGLADATGLLWAFHLVGFGTAALALTDRIWAWSAVAVLTGGYIVIGVQLYAVLLVPGLLTTFGWFANDIHIGLLALAEYLCIRRLVSAWPC